ncbi:MAG: hypothetical protein ACKOXK_03890 [Chakrabartia sp.]
MKAHTIRDRINARSSLAQLKEPAFRLIDTLQGFNPDLQVETLSLTLATLCRSAGIDPHEMITRSNRQLLEADTVRNPHLEAIAAYAAGEFQ